MKTQYDWIDVIGENAGTTKNYREKKWNHYYQSTYKEVVDKATSLSKKDSAIDVGTSHGYWFNYFKSKGFKSIYGVEIDAGRAKVAKTKGYTEVFNCDARSIPLESDTINFASSNDVFVHILQISDKEAVLKEVERILKKDGIFVFNHSMSKAYGFDKYTVVDYCSFMTLEEVKSMILRSTNFKILDICPTYYIFRNKLSTLQKIINNGLIVLPLGDKLYRSFNKKRIEKESIESSDYVYFILKKE